MGLTFTAIYEKGVLRPLQPLSLPEHEAIELRIVPRVTRAQKKLAHRQKVYEALHVAGLIEPQTDSGSAHPVSEAALSSAVAALAMAGPISELIIAERMESY
ncbi:MAG: antitoxin family protein [Caldilineales bacterium]|nr:antitoxin family protein [Caldilineales bacterium]MCW5858455.1 antitoxin family protein [Caldilineales bacterium]